MFGHKYPIFKENMTQGQRQIHLMRYVSKITILSLYQVYIVYS